MVRRGVRFRLGRLWGNIEDLTSPFPLGRVCAVMMVLGGLQSQRLGSCVPGKLSG